MVGAVIITHGSLGESLVDVAETISGRIEAIRTVSVRNADATDGIRDSLAEAVEEVSSGEGVIIFTDMFGGTPTNIAAVCWGVCRSRGMV
jgi:PTS system mannose-specific IIA component